MAEPLGVTVYAALGHVTPCSTEDDVLDGSGTDLIFGRESRVGETAMNAIMAESANELLGEFCHAVPLASVTSAMLDSVGLVGDGSVPPEINKSVVRHIAVTVATLCPRRSRTDKGLKNDVMDFPTGSPDTPVAERDRAPTAIVHAGVKCSPDVAHNRNEPIAGWRSRYSPPRPDRSVVTDAVAGVVGDVAVRDSRIARSHCHLPEGGSGQGGGR